jgi:hypothetical protein
VKVDLQVQRINEIVNWWFKLPNDFTAIAEIEYNLQRLTGLNYYYSGIVAQSYAKYLKTYIDRRVGVSRREVGKYSQMAQSKANAEAMAESADFMEAEITAEFEYNEHKLRLSAMGKVIEAMRQRISTLKNEKTHGNISGI